MLRTVDTDVLVLAIAFAGILQEQQVLQVEVWVAMGPGSHFRYIAAHEISNNLGSGMSKALPVFHSFTGCDTMSCFAGRGKFGGTSQPSQIPSYSLQLHLLVQ